MTKIPYSVTLLSILKVSRNKGEKTEKYTKFPFISSKNDYLCRLKMNNLVTNTLFLSGIASKSLFIYMYPIDNNRNNRLIWHCNVVLSDYRTWVSRHFSTVCQMRKHKRQTSLLYNRTECRRNYRPGRTSECAGRTGTSATELYLTHGRNRRYRRIGKRSQVKVKDWENKFLSPISAKQTLSSMYSVALTMIT